MHQMQGETLVLKAVDMSALSPMHVMEDEKLEDAAVSGPARNPRQSPQPEALSSTPRM